MSVLSPAGRRVVALLQPVTDAALHPPLVPSRYHPATWLTVLAEHGHERSDEILRTLSALLDQLVPALAEELLRRIDLTRVVQRHVDLDAVVAGVDLDAVAARLDVDAVARRLDVGSVVARLDLTKIVRDQVDLDSVVAGVDLNAAAARLDLDAVIARIDLAGLAEQVIAAVDLPGIIRGSTGSMASDTVTGVRMQSISGDEAIARAVDRLRLRRGRREASS
ncbi:MAG: hypothetical protein ABWX73_06940 [Marmoricola sp.]